LRFELVVPEIRLGAKRHTERRPRHRNRVFSLLFEKQGADSGSLTEVKYFCVCNAYKRVYAYKASDGSGFGRLRSTGSRRYERQRTRLKFGERFRVSNQLRAWISLSSSLHELTDTQTFKRQLKTFLFQQAYQ